MTVTRAATIEARHTGASSHLAAQSDPDASLGGHIASTRAGGMGVRVIEGARPAAIEYAALANPTGVGVLEAVSPEKVQWIAPGDANPGPAIEIPHGETRPVESETAERYVLVNRRTADDMHGVMAAVELVEPLNTVIAFDNVSDSQSSNGADEYRCVGILNDQLHEARSVGVHIDPLGDAEQTDQQQLPASGDGTLESSADLSGYPADTAVRIDRADGSLREMVYGHREGNLIDVPAGARGMLGTTASAGASDDVMRPVPPVRIALEAPSENPGGTAQTVPDESTEPSGRTWSLGIDEAGGLSIGTLGPKHHYYVWIHRQTPAGARGARAVTVALGLTASVPKHIGF